MAYFSDSLLVPTTSFRAPHDYVLHIVFTKAIYLTIEAALCDVLLDKSSDGTAVCNAVLLHILGGQSAPQRYRCNSTAHAFVNALQLLPDTLVNRAVPSSSTDKGTPGDTWAYNGFIHGVQSFGHIQRIATATW
jgi:hypothetical protein